MDIMFATNNHFCSHAAEAIVSLLENNRGTKITIHLFTIDCEINNIERICKLVGKYLVDDKK